MAAEIMSDLRALPLRRMALVLVAALIVQALILWSMGQPPICTCGAIRFWTNAVDSAENSQQISDWYTFSHVIHGMIFYAVIRAFLPRLSIVQAFAVAIAIEAGWEILENSPLIIERYREQALASGYSGDSVLNSVCDTIAASLGFVLAAVLPVRVTIALAVAMEIFTAVMVRDNLTLNVIQLIWPLESVGEWQQRRS